MPAGVLLDICYVKTTPRFSLFFLYLAGILIFIIALFQPSLVAHASGNYYLGNLIKYDYTDVTRPKGTRHDIGISEIHFSARPSAFSKLAPTNNATSQSLSPTMSWGVSSGASAYYYCFGKSNPCTNWTNNGTSLSTTIHGLAANTTYYWNVRAVNSYGTTYANASATDWSFKTWIVPGPFLKTAPANGASTLSTNPTLHWGVSSNATSYQYCIDTINDKACNKNWISSGTNTSVTLNNLVPGFTYYWQVRASNPNGTAYANGSSNAWWSFTIKEKVIFYVSLTGNDSNPGTFTQPFRTIQKGVNKLTAGNTLYIRGGTYAEKIDVRVSGSSSLPITISAYPGEKVVLDGTSLYPAVRLFTPLMEIYGSFVSVENLELTFPKGSGIRIWKNYSSSQTGSNDTLSNLNIHDMFGFGISSFGDHTLIENNQIWKTNLSNDCTNRNPNPDIGCGYPYWSGALSFGDTSNSNYGLNNIIRNNKVYQNYGEGILCMDTNNALIEGNIVYDNWAEDIYTDECSYTIIRNNLSYYTTDHEYWRSNTSPASGIMFSNEGHLSGYPVGHDLKIYNNIIVNSGVGIYFWTGFYPGSAAINTTIAYNTIVNNYSYGPDNGSGIVIDPPKNANHSNTIIEDNLVKVTGSPLTILSLPGVTYMYNLWSKAPSLKGIGDVIGDPLLSDPSRDVDTFIDPSWYTLTSLSPAIGKAKTISYIQQDYFWLTRDSLPDMGACEFFSH